MKGTKKTINTTKKTISTCLRELCEIVELPFSEKTKIKVISKYEQLNNIDWSLENYSFILFLAIDSEKYQLAEYLLTDRIKNIYLNNNPTAFVCLKRALNKVIIDNQVSTSSKMLNLLKDNLQKYNVNFNNCIEEIFVDIDDISYLNTDTIKLLESNEYKFSIDELARFRDINSIKHIFENNTKDNDSAQKLNIIERLLKEANYYCNVNLYNYLVEQNIDLVGPVSNEKHLDLLIKNINDGSNSPRTLEENAVYKMLKLHLSSGLRFINQLSEYGFNCLLNSIKFDGRDNPIDIIYNLKNLKSDFLPEIDIAEITKNGKGNLCLSAYEKYKYWNEIKKCQSDHGGLKYIPENSKNKSNLQILAAKKVVDNFEEMNEELQVVYYEKMSEIVMDLVTAVAMGSSPDIVDDF